MALSALTFMAQPRCEAQPKHLLKRDGPLIADGKGNPFIIRGMGLGGWMLQEGYMFKLAELGQQYRIKGAIELLVGKEETEQFYRQWLQNHTRKIDIDSMAAWGFNAIRLPMHYRLYTLSVEEEPDAGQNTWLDEGFSLTDSLLRWCQDNQVYLILDLHAAPGGQGNDLAISDRDPAKPSLWEREANKEKTIALWRKLAERYGKEEWVGGYDILNETNWGFDDPEDDKGISEVNNIPLRQLSIDITKAIREVDKEHLIFLEGNGFANNYRGIFPPWDDKLVVSFHKYGNFNEQRALSSFLEIRERYDLPLWLGEAGENSNTWFTEAIALCERNQIGWAWWQNKKMGINNPLEIKEPAGYQQLLDYWSGKGKKPTREATLATLNELLENLKLENNIYHTNVVDALFRQVNSDEAIPFLQDNTVRKNTSIQAVDYDLGRQRVAYYDTDSASYRFTPGVNTVGNRGRTYRNDGVDIYQDDEGHYIGHIEDGEWWQYTLQVEDGGIRHIVLQVATESEGGSISLLINGQLVAENIRLDPAKVSAWQSVAIAVDALPKGKNTMKVMAEKGGFLFRSVGFKP